METSLLEFYRELSAKSEEIGRLRALVELKDQTITGLTALLGMNGVKVNTAELATASSLTSQFPSVEHKCSCGKAIINSAVEKTTDSAKESMEKTIAELVEKSPRKVGRPKGSKNKSSATKVVSTPELEKSIGGTVFKDFVPLEMDNILTPNTNPHAYIPPEKKNSVLTVL